jgi:hypothetical protein
MSESARVQQIQTLIRDHLDRIGPRHWKAIRVQCPDVSDATFCRYVKAIKAERAQVAKGGAPDALVSPTADEAQQEELPAPGKFPEFYNPVQKARIYNSLQADAEILREQAVDSRGNIINWRMFDKSIQVRERLLQKQGEVMSLLHDQVLMNELYNAIIEATNGLPEEFQKVVVTRMHELNQRRFGGAKNVQDHSQPSHLSHVSGPPQPSP